MEHSSKYKKTQSHRNNKSTHHSQGRRNRPRVHKCALCNTELKGESYSNHYCRTNIELEATSYLKKLLRKESVPRQSFPQVQHVWADPHPEKKNIFLLKIKASPDIIPQFLEELKSHLVREIPKRQTSSPRYTPSPRHTHSPRNTPSPGHSNSRCPSPRQLVCSFYNSPDGCTNENCQRLHIDNPDEKERLIKLKGIIDKSKLLNPAIKGYVELLNFIMENNEELFEAIQKNFEVNLRQPTEKPHFQENIDFIRQSFEIGVELDDLRQELKMLSRRCYSNSNPSLIKQLEELISYTHQIVQEMENMEVSEDKIYRKSRDIYESQFLSRCLYVC